MISALDQDWHDVNEILLRAGFLRNADSVTQRFWHTVNRVPQHRYEVVGEVQTKVETSENEPSRFSTCSLNLTGLPSWKAQRRGAPHSRHQDKGKYRSFQSGQ